MPRAPMRLPCVCTNYELRSHRARIYERDERAKRETFVAEHEHCGRRCRARQVADAERVGHRPWRPDGEALFVRRVDRRTAAWRLAHRYPAERRAVVIEHAQSNRRRSWRDLECDTCHGTVARQLERATLEQVVEATQLEFDLAAVVQLVENGQAFGAEPELPA